MPVDEFGREIPGSAFVRASPSPPPLPRSARRHSDADEYPLRKRSRRSRGGSPSPSPHSRPRHRHPSELYVKDPMLCEYVWKDQKKRKTDETKWSTDDDKQDTETKQEETYDEYRREYCLNYVRAFFNKHMDDSWFRKMYSPLKKKRAVLDERERAVSECAAFRRQVSESPETFVEQARLGGGIKDTIPTIRKRKYGEADHHPSPNTVPQSHVLSTDERTIELGEIPPHVTDEHLRQALMEHCSNPSTIKIYSSSISANAKLPLGRRAFAIVESAERRKGILISLFQAHHHRLRAQDTATESGSHVPRKDDALPKELDLDVECSDPYGRHEVDEDGKGGGGGRPVQHRKCIVVVSTSSHHQPTLVLSAAVSSVERIPRDKDAAVMLARALDLTRLIPVENRLDKTLELLPSDLSPEDTLDVSIAYLRRVHLFSFYNGCTSSSCLGDVLAEKHAAGTIHLRLKGADDVLKEEDADNTTTDLLVQRLDDSISKASEKSTQWVESAGLYALDQELDAQAAEIEEAEEQARYDWLESHGIVDDAGRGRCSFHNCRKLFKDDTFLKKHLLKKHGEFLEAEKAKCHDSFMMKAWDQESARPVPPVLVDCGANFGLVPSIVMGAEPTAEDPEPELWRKEEEKRKQMEEHEERYKERREDIHAPRAPHNPDDAPRIRGSNFVDVDDMKEEKVELCFENVEVVAPLPKKKKKKKLL